MFYHGLEKTVSHCIKSSTQSLTQKNINSLELFYNKLAISYELLK